MRLVRTRFAAAFHKILPIRRISWALTKTANDDDQRIRNIFDQQRFRTVRPIIIYGLKNPGRAPELVQHMRGKLRGNPLQMQGVIFTQIAIAIDIGSILQHKSGKKKVTIFAYNPGFSEETIEGLKHSRIDVIQDLGEVIDGRSLIYGVSKQQGQILDSINLPSIERPEAHTPPAAIITDWKDILQPGSMEVISYVLFPGNLYSTKTTSRVSHSWGLPTPCVTFLRILTVAVTSSAITTWCHSWYFHHGSPQQKMKNGLCFGIATRPSDARKNVSYGTGRLKATRSEYTRATIEHNRLICAHEQRVDQLVQQLRDGGDPNGEVKDEAEARQRLSTESPARMTSYLNDPMMILLVCKGP